MEQYFINKFDWTEVVVCRDSQAYFDGFETHSSLALCHEADALDYGEPNPFVPASPGDISLVCRYSRLIGDYLAGLAEVREAAEGFVICLRYRLRGRRTRADVQADETSRDAHRLLHALEEFCGFVGRRTGFDEPELTWALQRAVKVLRAVGRSPECGGGQTPDGPTQFYLSTTRPLLMAARVSGRWLDEGAEVDSVYTPDYQQVSPLGAQWLLQVGSEFREGWAEARRFYGALAVVADCGDRIHVEFSEGEAQEHYERLVAACVNDQEELTDYLAFISDLRRAAVLNAKTLLVAERLLGEPLLPR